MGSLGFVSRSLLQNLAMGIGPVRALARRWHRTGLERDPRLVAETLAYLRGHANLSGARVLDFGMGRTPELLLGALADGAKGAAAADVAPYFPAAEARALGIDYRVYDGRRLPWEDGSFDVVWAWDVLQHVREPAQTLADLARVTAAGGRLLCRVDLRDHYRLADQGRWLDCLEYSPALWRAMTSNRSSYVNRLRLSEWMKLFAESGFSVEERLLDEEPLLLELRQGREFLRAISDDDLRCWRFRACLRRSG